MRRTPWTPEQLERLGNGYEEGTPLRLIAESLGRKATTCSAMAIRLGLSHAKKFVNHRYQKPFSAEARWRNQHSTGELPTLPYVPGISVTGRYQMRAP